MPGRLSVSMKYVMMCLYSSKLGQKSRRYAYLEWS